MAMSEAALYDQWDIVRWVGHSEVGVIEIGGIPCEGPKLHMYEVMCQEA
jgi:hypothetical protein